MIFSLRLGALGAEARQALVINLPIRCRQFRNKVTPWPSNRAPTPPYLLCCASQASSSAPQPPPSRPPRFYVLEPLLSSRNGSLVRLPLTEAQHASRTLRMKEGDSLEICDGAGAIALAEISALDKKGAMLRLIENPIIIPKETWEWTIAVACGSLKGGRADWLVEKAAELGAASLQPLLTVRSPTIAGSDRAAEKGAKSGGRKKLKGQEEQEHEESGREGRWHRVAAAAMKQSLRARAMRIEVPCSVGELCEGLAGKDIAFIGTEGAPPIHIVAAEVAAAGISLADSENSTEGSNSSFSSSSPRQGVLIIGPEGDFTAEEVQKIVAAGARGVGLGPLRLRTETAAVAMLSYARLAFH